jgi:hypothetical protein
MSYCKVTIWPLYMVKNVAISSEISHLLFYLSINYVNPFDIPDLTVSMIQHFVVLGDYCMFLMVCFYDFSSRFETRPF